ncbi:hypothetical protein KP509_01G091100 [Ceratopteris richardii]|uniref:GATA-type domain-containing protein n=1 Tax=Ceratopteris richardii TaxID=49495 RepID=A0A8T2VNH5_CERRI|nr:hypothetical protein KP509_01G091100 [Ceratopteris richardii]
MEAAHISSRSRELFKSADATHNMLHTKSIEIDDLLDFSNGNVSELIEPFSSNACLSGLETKPPKTMTSFERKLSDTSTVIDYDLLRLPNDDLPELEWLSNFVEESFCSAYAQSLSSSVCVMAEACATEAVRGDVHKPSGRNKDELFHSRGLNSPLDSITLFREKKRSSSSSSSVFWTPQTHIIPGRTRSKRCRTPACFWNAGILATDVSESLLIDKSSICDVPEEPLRDFYHHDKEEEDEEESHKLNEEDLQYHVSYDNMSASVQKVKTSIFSKHSKFVDPRTRTTRTCLHCMIQTTPQWRAGPMGPKTLCNACGVRYKSGRLYEEYRPAASPTFVESLHSNSHGKVLEMRRKKSIIGMAEVPAVNGHKLSKGDMRTLHWETTARNNDGIRAAEALTVYRSRSCEGGGPKD